MYNLTKLHYYYDMTDLKRIHNDEDAVMSRVLFENSSSFLSVWAFIED